MTVGTPHAARRKALAARTMPCMAALLFALLLSGCGAGAYFSPKLPYAKLEIPYSSTQLGRSTSLEVLNIVRNPAYQFDPNQVEQVLLTQSDTVIGFSGRSADTRKTWLNLIAFDEYRMTARRKYFFCSDERVRKGIRCPLFSPCKGILFDAQFLIDTDVLTTPYATEEAQRIAILRWLSDQFQRDATALVGNLKAPAQGSDAITLSAMMVGEVFQGVFVELDKSPGLTADLAGERGIPFPHMSLKQGRIRLLTQNELGVVKIRIHLPMTESR
jgi:hypothetical protein